MLRCSKHQPFHCVLNTVVDKALRLSQCGLTAGTGHGDPLFLVNAGQCPDEAGLAWARFRANMSAVSAVKEVCGVDTCYEWESCGTSTSWALTGSRSQFHSDTHTPKHTNT